MYINKIDDLIDKVIDDFYNNVILTDKTLQKIFSEPNFVKYQKEINLIMTKFVEQINLSEIKELVKSNDAINTIFETIKRYIAFYLFLTIGFNYTAKDDTYINNIVEFTKNQSEFGYKINNFFNSESNAKVIKYHIMIRNIITLLGSDREKIEILKVKPDFKEAILFLNSLGSEFIERHFKLKKDQTQLKGHYMMKTVIIMLLYKVSEKREFFKLLEMSENLEGEYMFIDIVVPKQKYIDYSSVEKLIGASPAVKNLAYYLWDFVTKYEDSLQIPPVSVEEKITLLIKSGILYPICDDFLLYHKESERYDKAIDPSKIKIKEDTKIRHIINKIESTSEYYSDQVKKDEKIKNNIKKNFYIPLLNRKAISVNYNEDINIINKFINMGKRSIENNEYFNDLLGYMVYPYINFKDFDKYGFTITFPKTIDVVRGVSFENTGDFKQNTNNIIQLRVGTKDTHVNIIGFVVPTNLKPIQCLKIRDMIDVRSLDEQNSNGFDLIVKYIRKSMFGKKKHESSVYWLFDLEKDFVTKNELFEQEKYSSSEQIKKIISSLYDTILIELYYIILNKLETEKSLGVQKAYKMLKMYEKKLIDFPDRSSVLDDIELKIFELMEKIIPEYDKYEDIVFGHDDFIRLPENPVPERPKYQTIKINLESGDKLLESEKLDGAKEIVNAICHHGVQWEKISSLQKTDIKKYTNELYDFIQQYVIENVDQEYVCKSCGYQLNIKKYILDGVFDDDTQKFVTYSMPIDIPLEDIPEYEKYKITIRNIDKLIEKIASTSNIAYLTRSSYGTKWKRRIIVKDVIDLLTINNTKLKPILKERNEMASKKYGINRDLSNLFVFELENSIFGFSSKERDYYKSIKQNNILSYITYIILLELNESHVSYLGSEKKGLCNFLVFDKIYKHLFEGINIIINSKGDVSNVLNYKILCYMVYIIGCSVIKYNMWSYDQDATKKKTPNIIIGIQKMFVHTLFDIINSVLENSNALTSVSKSQSLGSNYIYEIMSVRTYKKLETMFKDEELYQRLKSESVTSQIGTSHILEISTRNKKLSGKFSPMTYELPIVRICKIPKMFIKKKVYDHYKYYEINNVTNCPNGQFHEWETKDKRYICKLCGSVARDLEYDKQESNKIFHNFKFVRLQNLTSKFCLEDGLPHQFIINESGQNICIKCKNTDDHIYTHDELNKLDMVLADVKRKQFEIILNKTNEINTSNTKENEYVKHVVDKYVKLYNKSNENGFYDFINKILDDFQSILGNETSYGNLRENVYVINHDYIGTDLDKPIIITETSNKIFYKQNHQFFKTDVIYYTSHAKGKIDVFYDATTRILLGYKEESKSFIINKKHDKRLIINYSISNKLKFLGFRSHFIRLEDNENINDLIRERIFNLKKILYVFQRILYRIYNNYTVATDSGQSGHLPEHANIDKRFATNLALTDFFSKKMNDIVNKYKKRFAHINIYDKNGEHLVFKHWKGIIRGIQVDEIKMEKITEIINVNDIIKNDKNGNVILYFIVSEFVKLLEYNQEKFLRASMAEFLIEFINNEFESFNTEKIMDNIDIKRFSYLLSSHTYIQEISEKVGTNVGGIYEEYQDPDAEIPPEEKEELSNLQEENDALDLDMDVENEYPYESNIDKAEDWEPAGEIIYNPNA